MKDYPEGDGLPGCQFCHGRGVVSVPPERRPQRIIGDVTEICACVMIRDVVMNMERGWKGLTKAPPLGSHSLLKEFIDQSVWVTASTLVFRQHLKHIAGRMGPRWDFVVVSDADLMDAWLSYGIDVYDADVDAKRRSKVKDKYAALVDLVEPPDLLIIHLGVKAARNSAMPEVLLEAVKHREHIDRPTWVVDQPNYPLADGHISFNQQVHDFMATWKHVVVEGGSQDRSLGLRMMTFDGADVPVTPIQPVKKNKSLLTPTDAAGRKKDKPSKKGGPR